MNMTPMIDVVFLLIIFFLVSSHLARQETQLEVDLPRATTGDADKPFQRPRITINVLSTGEALLAGAPTPAEQLAERLKHEQASNSEGVEVRIRGDRNTPYKYVEPLLVACAKAGVWRVTFAVRQER